MKQFFSLLFLFVFVSGLSLAQDTAQEIAPASSGQAVISGHGGSPIWEAPGAVLYDQSELVNDPGGGFGGADRSFIESALGHTLFGWGHQVVNNNSMADDFTVPAGETWQIDELITFAYQTGATTTSTITEVRAQIWDGNPMSGGTVIWGNLTTNIMTNTVWANMYRTTDTDPTNTQRAVMVQTSTIGTTLTEGTYWIEWQSNGTLASGPWCPPRTILGMAVTGDALQNVAGVWQAALNGTQPAGAPFILMGTSGGGGTTFTDDFDSYTAGQQLACQNPTDWTTWSNLPCDPVEDAYISSTYSYSGANSTVIVQNNDLVKPYGQLTSGDWYISFLVYIPTGKAGYFNTLAGFTPNPFNWGMECYFDVGGGGRLLGGSATAHTFTWQENTWQQVVVRVNLDTDQATMWFGTTDPLTEVATWQWTLGASGGGSPLQLDANDFFGATANDEMYFDNFYFGDAMPPIIPVELTSFTAIANNGVVELNWETATEINNNVFEIERKTDVTDFVTIGFVQGAGTTTEPQNYRYTDNNVEVGSYTYRLKQIDFDGTYSYSDAVEVDVTAPLAFNLEQNYPNPFNPSTKINYSVPEAGNVKLSVYNLVGEEVAVLLNGYTDAGHFEVSFDASNLPSGVYLYKLQSDNSVQTKKMMLLK